MSYNEVDNLCWKLINLLSEVDINSVNHITTFMFTDYVDMVDNKVVIPKPESPK